MEKPSSSKELQCVGTLEIVRPRPVGFLCGSIPVPTDKTYHLSLDSSALVPSSPQLFSAPRYRQLPRETDLNTLPVVSNMPERFLPSTAVLSKSIGDLHWEGETIPANHNRKCEALAVAGLADYGDEIDVIAPTDILKQIFKMPYSKSRLSIAVRRIGQTLVLTAGPDIEEGEKLVRSYKGQATCAEHSLYSNFATHSVRVEACDCPPSHQMSTEEKASSCLSASENTSQTRGQCYDTALGGEPTHSESSWVKQEDLQWGIKSAEGNKNCHPVKKGSSVQEPDKHKRVCNDGFLHALFWNFHNFRMLLGSDMLIFSNEKYVAVSLHLWDVTRKVTPLTWLDTWLDNVMASVPELAICYHHNGVVQSYELLKTDEIIRKGISENGYSAFHPHVVQQNGLSVLRFLQENCKQDPGAYWLYKTAGEDIIQLFDLSAMPNCSSDSDHDSRSLPSLVHRGRSDALLSLGTLLYRVGHRLSLSVASNNRAKCAAFFRKCLEVLDDPDHLVVRACAHEQFARVLLSCSKEFELTSECLPLEYEVAVFESFDNSDGGCELFIDEHISSLAEELIEGGKIRDETMSEVAGDLSLETDGFTSKELITSVGTELSNSDGTQPVEGSLAVRRTLPSSSQVFQTISDPISSKLAAIHHVSQAIKSLRWKHQLQGTESELIEHDNSHEDIPCEVNLSICTCGDVDCIEVCDIWEWLPTAKIDNQLWKLVRLLGESYLSLGQAFTEENQLVQALNVVKIACSVYGSMPQNFGDARFMSSIARHSSPRKRIEDSQGSMSYRVDEEAGSNSGNDVMALEHLSSTYLFWSKAWTLVGDVHVQFYLSKGEELPKQASCRLSSKRLRVPSEVVKEVQRLKKRLGEYNQNCSSCSLVNCSCQSDRASSGSSASSSRVDGHALVFGKKPGRRSSGRNVTYSNTGNFDRGHIHHEVGTKTNLNCEECNVGNGHSQLLPFGTMEDVAGMKSLMVDNSETTEEDLSLHDAGCKSSGSSGLSVKQKATRKKGGIFKYLCDSAIADGEYNLSAALCCYKEARKVVCGNLAGSEESGSVTKKLGWVFNEMGRNKLARRQLIEAELAFADAVSAFREVSDFANIILIYCNLGHGRRALAEDIVSNLELLKSQTTSHDSWKQDLETAKIEYCKSIRYYGAAKSELVSLKEGTESVPSNLRNDVYTQYAHTYLRLGMLLAREDSTAELCKSKAVKDFSVFHFSSCIMQSTTKIRKHEITAKDAIMEAVSSYESLGELRKQEAAYAYFQLACYQRDCCLKFLQSDYEQWNFFKDKNKTLHLVRQYARLAENYWQRALEFYGPVTHPFMYLSIIIERSALSLSLSSDLHSHQMLDSALSCMLDGRHISDAVADFFASDYPEAHEKFWNQLRMILRKMLSTALSANSTKSSTKQPTMLPNGSADSGKLRELYAISLKSTDLSQVKKMHVLWSS